MKLATNGWKEISHQINFIHLGELLTNLAPRVRQDIRRLIFRFGASGGRYSQDFLCSFSPRPVENFRVSKYQDCVVLRDLAANFVLHLGYDPMLKLHQYGNRKGSCSKKKIPESS